MMRSQLVFGWILMLGACKSKTRDKAPLAGSGSSVTASVGSAAASESASEASAGSADGAAPVRWERQDLSKLAISLPVSGEVPSGITIETHRAAYGNGEKPWSSIDLVGADWTVNLEPIRGKEPPTAAAAARGRALTPEMLVISKELPDGGWLLVWTQPNNEHFLASLRKTAKVVCDGSGPIKAEDVETVLKLCDSIQPAS
jgi:hypothetical protein